MSLLLQFEILRVNEVENVIILTVYEYLLVQM